MWLLISDRRNWFGCKCLLQQLLSRNTSSTSPHNCSITASKYTDVDHGKMMQDVMTCHVARFHVLRLTSQCCGASEHLALEWFHSSVKSSKARRQLLRFARHHLGKELFCECAGDLHLFFATMPCIRFVRLLYSYSSNVSMQAKRHQHAEIPDLWQPNNMQIHNNYSA